MSLLRNRWLAMAVIVAAGLAAYASCYRGAFVLDDLTSITENPTILRLSDLSAVLEPLRGQGWTVEGRPLLNLTLAINYALGGLNVAGYHAVNVGIHLLAGLTLFGLLRRLTGSVGAAWAAALLWTVHPLNTAAVTYVVQRAESLMGLFYLLTLAGFGWSAISLPSEALAKGAGRAEQALGSAGDGQRESLGAEPSSDQRARRSRSTIGSHIGLVFSVICCWLGMATKEVMVSAPLAVLLLDRLAVSGSFSAAWRSRRGYYLALASSWLLLAVLVGHTGSRGQTSGFGSGVSAAQYWLTQPGVILRYLKLAVWPAPLIFDSGTAWTVVTARAVLAALAIAGLAAGTIHGLVKNRPWGLLGFVFFATLAPTSLIPGNRQTAADHRMYLALAAVMVGMVLAGRWWSKRGATAGSVGRFSMGNSGRRDRGSARARVERDLRARLADPGAQPARPKVTLRPAMTLAAPVGPTTQAAQLAIVGLIALVFVTVTYRRNLDFRSPIALYGADVAHAPENAYAQTNYATALLLAKDYAAAVPHFEAALRLDADIQETEDNLGNALFALGQDDAARAHFRHAIALRPNFADPYNNLAVLELKHGEVSQARQELETAVRLSPDFAAAHAHLGVALLQQRQVPAALEELRRATALDPGSAEHWIDLGNALREAQQPAAAREAFNRAQRLEPANAAVYYNAAGPEMDLQHYAAAAALLRQAVQLDPANPAAHENLGNALFRQNEAAAAVAEYETAVRLAPDDALLHYNLGNGLLSLRRQDDAVAELRAALRLNPELQPARELLRAAGAPAR